MKTCKMEMKNWKNEKGKNWKTKNGKQLKHGRKTNMEMEK